MMVDKVVGKKDGVALLSIDEVNDGTSVTFMSIAKGADMKIGELGDAVTIKLFGQVGEVEGLLVYDVVASPNEIAETEQGNGKEGKCHAHDAEDADEEAVVALSGLGTPCDESVDQVPDAVQDHKKGFGCTEEEK